LNLPASEFAWVNPAPPESPIQILADYMPIYRTVVLVSICVGLMILPGGGALAPVYSSYLLCDDFERTAWRRSQTANSLALVSPQVRC
jgi:hypothetical protein